MASNTNLETTHTIDVSDRLYKLPIALITVLGLVGGGWVLAQFGELPQNQPHEIQVSGEGKAYAKPDIAMISFGVHSEAVKSQDAVNSNNTKMNAVIKAIKESGVEGKDIQTTMYNLQPTYGYEVMPMGASSAGSDGKAVAMYPTQVRQSVITGYSVDQQVSVKIRNFDNINTILDKATVAGANTVGSLYFAVDDMEKVQAEARAQAIMKAKEKANRMVEGTGLRLGKITNISEGYGGGYPSPMYSSVMAKDSAESVAPSIQTGQMEVNITVNLTYQVK